MAHPDWFDQKRIILGVTGGIACYKACEIARQLGRLGATVQVVMTEAATAFVSPLTFQALTGHAVRTSLLDADAEAGMGHIELARWADLILVAPCTANTLTTLASGGADELLSALWLASTAPKAVAPAMNQAMWSHATITHQCQQLAAQGTWVLGPDAGVQACGDIGLGRMLEPDALIDALLDRIEAGPLDGRQILITAGPTFEPIDPVRYIANRSSGKMGFALAAEATRLGAVVELIAGPVQLATPKGVRRTDVETANQMHQAVLERVAAADMLIAAAAVSDMRPIQSAPHKLKKQSDPLDHLELVENPDIVHSVATHTHRPALVVGFAAETQDVEHHARLKLQRKSLDCIIANDVSAGQVFGLDTTAVSIIEPQRSKRIAATTKEDAAQAILAHLTVLLNQGLPDGTAI